MFAEARFVPLGGAIQRILARALRQPPLALMAREIQLIIGDWQLEFDGQIVDLRTRVRELHKHLITATSDAEEHASDIDLCDVDAVGCAQYTWAALVVCRNTTAEWLDAYF